ncbi:MAG TPA: helix-hairpin-helix domain-containing protein [Candidatus Paceibacterota bacterium]
MTHRKLLILMAGLLVLAAGGVFLLVHQGGDSGEIPQEALVAGVEQVVEPETQKDEMTEVKVQIEQKVSKPTPSPITPKPLTPPPPLLSPTEKTPSLTPTSTPTITPLPPPSNPEPPPPPPPVLEEKININTANLEELDQITGVGPAIAQRVIDYRNQNGPFQTIEEIKNVSGIGDITFEKMKDEITVGDVISQPSPLPPPPPTPTPAPAPSPLPQPEGHTFYTSSYWSSKLYYCDTDAAWKNLSEKYLESYPSEDAVLAEYPEKTLHEPCE